MGCREPPELEAKTVGKMGLKVGRVQQSPRSKHLAIA
jgi:hypothetical protein